MLSEKYTPDIDVFGEYTAMQGCGAKPFAGGCAACRNNRRQMWAVLLADGAGNADLTLLAGHLNSG